MSKVICVPLWPLSKGPVDKGQERNDIMGISKRIGLEPQAVDPVPPLITVLLREKPGLPCPLAHAYVKRSGRRRHSRIRRGIDHVKRYFAMGAGRLIFSLPTARVAMFAAVRYGSGLHKNHERLPWKNA